MPDGIGQREAISQSVGWFVSLLVREEVLLADLCERKILFRLKIYDRLRQATAKRGKQHVPGSWQLARAGKQQGAQRRRPGRRRPERSAVHSTPATIGDGQCPIAD